MSVNNKNNQNILKLNEGINSAERYLHAICKRTFLSLWSYPGLFKKPGKELCDILIVFGNDIIIFSDKNCKFPKSDNLEKDWRRWFNKAIYESARQVWGAERWIRQFPERIYSDKKAEIPFPFKIQKSADLKFHLIVVAHNGSKRCAEEMGGSGSFMLVSNIVGINNHVRPFTIGDLDPEKTFVHVLDDTSLNILLKKLDTITDFVAYLRKKESLFRSNLDILVAGEEELLAYYLKDINSEGEHDFIIPKDLNIIAIEEGFWEKYIKSEQVAKQIAADKISYTWDRLIEKFNYHALAGTQYLTSKSPLHSSEKIMRLLAKESRTHRRMLSKKLIDLLEKTPADKQAASYCGPRKPDTNDTTYVFLLFPRSKDINDEEYRNRRGILLKAYCQIAKIRIPYAKDIVGIATESGIENKFRSEDSIYFDASEWNTERQKEAEKLFEDMGLPKEVKINYYSEDEYPEIVSYDPNVLTKKLSKNPRNKPCPCGSGKKYKKCHGIK